MDFLLLSLLYRLPPLRRWPVSEGLSSVPWDREQQPPKRSSNWTPGNHGGSNSCTSLEIYVVICFHMFLWYGPTKIVSSMTPWRQEPKLKMQFSCWRLFHVLEIHISFRCVISLPQMLLLGKTSEKPSHQFPSELKDRFYHVNMTMVPELDTWYKENVGHTRKPLYWWGPNVSGPFATAMPCKIVQGIHQPSGDANKCARTSAGKLGARCPKIQPLWCSCACTKQQKCKEPDWPVLVGSQSHLILCRIIPKSSTFIQNHP